MSGHQTTPEHSPYQKLLFVVHVLCYSVARAYHSLITNENPFLANPAPRSSDVAACSAEAKYISISVLQEVQQHVIE